jgi:hypothetical protein
MAFAPLEREELRIFPVDGQSFRVAAIPFTSFISQIDSHSISDDCLIAKKLGLPDLEESAIRRTVSPSESAEWIIDPSKFELIGNIDEEVMFPVELTENCRHRTTVQPLMYCSVVSKARNSRPVS